MKLKSYVYEYGKLLTLGLLCYLVLKGDFNDIVK